MIAMDIRRFVSATLAGIIPSFAWAAAPFLSGGSGILSGPINTGSGVTYYVSNAGSDSNVGTSQALPWKTLAKVGSSTFAPGSQILFQAGNIWREHLTLPSSGTSNNPIAISSYGTGANPVLTNSTAENSTGNWTPASGNTWYATDATFSSDVGSISWGSPATNILTAKVSSLGALTSQGQFFADGANSRVYVYSATNPASAYPGGIECWWGSIGGSSIVYAPSINYINWQNVDLKYGGFNGLEIRNATNWNIQNSTASYIGGAYFVGTIRAGLGIQIDEGSSNITINGVNTLEIINQGIGIENANSTGNITNVLIENSTLDKSAQSGIEIANSSSSSFSNSGITIQNNTIENSGMGQWGVIEGAPGSDGIHSYNSGSSQGVNSGILITGNLITGNEGIAIHAENGTNDVTATYNVLANNGQDGINVAATNNPNSESLTAYYNLIFSNAGNGLYFSNAFGSGYAIIGNSVYGNGTDANSTYNANIQNFSGTRSIKNNIFFGVNSMAFFSQFAAAGGSTTDYNDYYRASGNLISYNGTAYTTAQFAAYKTASSQDAHGFYGNPTFTSAPTDFTLLTGSPAIGTGVTLGAPYGSGLAAGSTWPAGVVTKAQTTMWEIGAYVYP